MAKQFTVKARFVAEDKASGPIAKVESRFQRLTKTIKSSAVAQVAALGGVVVALRGLTRFIGSSIEKANQQEVAVNQLNAALSSLGPTAGAVSKALQEQAAALQKVTTFGDETIIAVQTMIASFVKNEDQIKAATAATLDFSVAFGIDLKAAAALVAKSLGSTTNALTRYGIEVEGAVGSTERLSSLVENIATVAGGRAAAAVNTFAGAWQQFTNVLGDVQEDLAGVGTKSTAVIGIIRSATKVVQDNAQSLVTVLQVLGSLLGGLFDKVSKLTIPFQLLGKAIGFLTVQFQTLGDDVEISNDAIKASADRAGTSVEDLTRKLEDARGPVGAVKREVEKLDTAQRGAAASAAALAKEEANLEARTENLKGDTADLAGALTTALEPALVATNSEIVRGTVEFRDQAVAVASLRDLIVDLTTKTGELTQAQQRRLNLSTRRGLLDQPRGIGIDPDPLFPGLSGTRGTFTTITPVRFDANGNIIG